MAISVLPFKIKLLSLQVCVFTLPKFDLILNWIKWLRCLLYLRITFNHSFGLFVQQIHWLYVCVRSAFVVSFVCFVSPPPWLNDGHPSHLKQAVWEDQWAWPCAVALPKGFGWQETNRMRACESGQSVNGTPDRESQSVSYTAKQHGKGACLLAEAGVGCRSSSWALRPITDWGLLKSNQWRSREWSEITVHCGSSPCTLAYARKNQNGQTWASVTVRADLLRDWRLEHPTGARIVMSTGQSFPGTQKLWGTIQQLAVVQINKPLSWKQSNKHLQFLSWCQSLSVFPARRITRDQR